MDAEATRARGTIHGFAVATALGAYLLIVLGGLVTGPAGFPLLAGRPHRLAAGLVGALTLALAVALTRGRQRPLAIGWLAVALVAAQGALGGLGLVLGISPALGAAHTGVSIVVFLALFYVAAQTGVNADSRPTLAPAARRLALVSAIAVLFQALFGALVRASAPGAWQIAASLQVVHRMGAVVTAVIVFAASVKAVRATGARPWLRVLALATPVLAAAQISLGVRSVQTLLDAATVQAHLAVGAALLAACWALYVLSAPTRTVAAASGRARAFVELGKPRLTSLVVVTFAGGLWMAPGALPAWRSALALLGTVLIVAAANALNMFIERDIDRHMARTALRPLPEGRLSPEQALGFAVAVACVAVPMLVVGANLLTAALGVLAFALYVWAYTPLKRVSWLAVFVGAVPGAMPPLMGWTTGRATIDAGGLALFALMFVWQVPHFLAISMFRADEYGRAGFAVLPNTGGMRLTRGWIVATTLAMVAASVLPALFGVAGRVYVVGALAVGAWFAWSALRRDDNDRGWSRRVFFTSLGYISALFAVLAVAHALGA